MTRFRKLLLVNLILATILITGATLTLARGNSQVFYACVNKSSGTIKMVSADSSCNNNETKISWNSTGPQGIQGPPGPAGPVPDRFVDLGDGTVLDRHTGLVWLKDANCSTISPKDWYEATSSVAELESGICGLSDGSWMGDWRLPTKTEWMATIAEAKALGCTDIALTDKTGTTCFSAGTQWAENVQTLGCGYWSGTTPVGSPDVAAYVFLSPGGFGPGSKDNDCFWVWPVRRGQ